MKALYKKCLEGFQYFLNQLYCPSCYAEVKTQQWSTVNFVVHVNNLLLAKWFHATRVNANMFGFIMNV